MMRVQDSKDLLVRLEQVEDGVRVVVIDGEEEWFLLHLSEKGIELYGNIPTDVGIAIDADGKMLVREETR